MHRLINYSEKYSCDEEFHDVIIRRQTYSAVLHISSVSLFRGRGMPILNKNQST